MEATLLTIQRVFPGVLRMSISASWFVLAVLVLRLVLRRAPKWSRCLLWALVAVRLICPVLPESPVSMVPQVGASVSAEEKILTGVIDGTLPALEFETPRDRAINHAAETAGLNGWVSTSASPSQYLPFLWAGGMIAMVLYALVSYLRLRRRVVASLPLEGNTLLCDEIASPFVLGVFRPRIYLPSNLAEPQLSHVVAHERAHLARHDHWWKPLGFLLLSIYWFNPLLWLAYILLCRDIELACDEHVVRNMGVDDRADYSQALLDCSRSRRIIAVCPLAFGEVGVKERVKAVLKYKRPAFWVVIVALAACVVVAVCFLTNPVSGQSEAVGETYVIEKASGRGAGVDDFESYLNEYEEFGIILDNGKLTYHEQRVRYFLDGYERSDGQGDPDIFARYQYYDGEGVVDIHTVRNDKKNSDGSTTLFGPITDIVPYPQEEFNIREYKVSDSVAITTEGENALSEENGEISIAIGNGGEGGISIADIMKQYIRYGITYETIDGGKGNIYYNGQLIGGFCDQKPDGSVFVAHSTNHGEGTAYSVYDDGNEITGIVVR